MKNEDAKDRDVDQQHYLPNSDVARVVRHGRHIASAQDVYRELEHLGRELQEHFAVLDLSARHNVLACRVVHIGTLTGVDVHPREIFRGAIVNAAAAIIVAHNHPSGDPEPSRQDIEITGRLREVGDLCGIPVLDHLVIVANGYVSLAARDWR